MKYARFLSNCLIVSIIAFYLMPTPALATENLPGRPAAFMIRDLLPNSETPLSLPFEPFHSELSVQLHGNLTGGTDAQNADAVMVWSSDTQQYIAAYKSATDALWYADLELTSPASFSLSIGLPFWLCNVQDVTQTVAFGGVLPPLSILVSNKLDLFSIKPSVFSPGYNYFSSGSAVPHSINPELLRNAGASASNNPLYADRLHAAEEQFSFYLSPLGESFAWKNAAGELLDPPVLPPASAWWYNHAGTNTFTLSGLPMPASGWPLGEMGIMDIQLTANNTAALTVFPPDVPGAVLAVLYQDNPQSLADLTNANWSVLAEGLCPQQGQPFTLVDTTIADNRAAGDIRLYLVVRCDSDSDGDGLADDIERLVYGTNPEHPDSDGDNVNDADDLNPLIPSPAGIDPSKTALWLRTDSTVVNAQNQITQWLSASTNTLAFTPSDITHAPLLVEDADGVTFAHFDGDNDSLHSSLAPDNQPLTMICVARFDSAGQPPAYENSLFHYGDRNETNGSLSFCRGSSDSDFNLFTLYGPDNARSYGPAIPDNKWQVTSIEWATPLQTENRISINGVQRECEQNSPVTLTDPRMTLGALRTTGIETTDNLQGDIAEIILLRGDISLAERNAIESYLAQKYAINESPVITTEDYVLAPIGSNTVEITAVVTDDSMPAGSQLSTSLQLINNACQALVLPVEQSDQLDGLTRSRTLTWRVTAQYAGACLLKLNASDGAKQSSSSIQILFREFQAADVPQEALKLWLRADSIAATNNAPVTEWRNLAQTSSRITQTAIQNAPLFLASGVNGVPSIKFDGTNDWLQGAFDSEALPLTVISVVKYAQELQPAGDSECLYTIRDHSTPLTRLTMGRGQGGPSNSNCYAYWLTDESNPCFGPALTGGVWQVFNTIHASQSPYHRFTLNGYPQEVQESTGDLAHRGAIEIGRLATELSGKYYFNGEITEMLVYERLLNSNELACVENYLAERYRLPNSHFDRDGDGISDAFEDLLNRDITPNPLYQFPFRERFELDTIPFPESIDGFNGWHLLPDTIASTQTNIVSEGRRALHIQTEATDADLMRTGVARPFAGVSDPVVWFDFDLNWQPAPAPDEAYLRANPCSVTFYVKSQNTLAALNGPLDQGGEWLNLPCAPSTNKWRQITLKLDYQLRTWLICVDGRLLADNIRFGAEDSFLSHMRMLGNSAYLDNITVSRTVPAGVSADGDSLDDLWEYETFGHLDFDDNSDPDNDGLTIAEELKLGTDPTLADTDGDGMPDGWEVVHGLNPLDPADAALDPDGDGLTNLREYLNGTDPHNPDTDNDGLSDGMEVDLIGSSPVNRDTDNDGMSDGMEYSLGFSPTEQNNFFRIDHNSGQTYWYTSFEADEGYQPGPIDGVQAWQASAQCVAIINTAAASGLQAVEIPPHVDGQPAEVLNAYIGGDLRSQVWMTWYQRFTPGMPDQSLIDENSAAIICFPTNSVAAYDVSKKRWIMAASPIPLQYNEFVRIDVNLDYTAKKYMVCVNGVAQLTDINFANPSNSVLSKFSIQGGSTTSSFILDDITISIDEPAELDFDGDLLLNSEERALGTDIWQADSDGDGISDFDEVSVFHTDPNRDDIDNDNDGLFNAEELLIGLDPDTPYSNGADQPDHTALMIEPASSAVSTQGDWITADSELVAETATPHSLTHSFNITTAGVYRIAFFVSDFVNTAAQTHFQISVNGEEAAGMPNVLLPPYDCDLDHVHCSGTLNLCGTCADDHQSHCHKYSKPLTAYTSWLKPGTHSATLTWLPESDSPVRPAAHQFMLGKVNSPDPRWYMNITGGDLDGDGLPDIWEIAYGLDPKINNARADTDSDGLTNLEELLYGFDPTDGNSDNDHDGLPDAEEIHLFGTSPLKADSNGNGITDGYSILSLDGTAAAYTFGSWTNLNTTLAALDVFTMRAEYVVPVETAGMYRVVVKATNTYPGSSNRTPFRIQVLVDGIRIGWLAVTPDTHDPRHDSITLPWLTAREHVIRLAWLDDYAPGKLLGIQSMTLQAVDAPDLNQNNIADWQERLLAQNIDSDGDGLTDGAEVKIHGTDPLLRDTDGDTLPDGTELNITFTSPLLIDSNTNSIPDAVLLVTKDPRDTSYRAADHITTAWLEDGPLLYNPKHGQLVSYDFNITNAGIHRVELELRNYAHDLPDNYRFRVEVYCDGHKIGTTYVVADTDRSGTLGLITPWLTENTHTISYCWINDADSNMRSATIALLAVRLYAFDSPDLNGDGIADWQELYVKKAGDTDRDGLSDYDEITKYFSDPLNPDTNGDGINDGLAISMGLNPNLLDSDGDGVSDWQELYDLHSDPLVAEFDGTMQVISVVNGGDATQYSGSWSVGGQAALCLSWSGSALYNLNVASNDYYALVVEFTDSGLHSDSQGRIALQIDDRDMGTMRIIRSSGKVMFFVKLSQGAHVARIIWKGDAPEMGIGIRSVSLQIPGGFDADGNGIADWIEILAAQENVTEMPLASHTSPVCVEGVGRQSQFVELLSSHIPEGFTNGVVAVQSGLENHWYANVYLSPTSETALAVSLLQDDSADIHHITWEPFNIFQEGVTNSPVIRGGDSMLLAAYPAAATNGVSEIAVLYNNANLTNLLADITVPAQYCFENKGEYTLVAEYLDGISTLSATSIVTVVADRLPVDNPICLLNATRNWRCPDITSYSVVESDPTLTARVTANTLGGADLTLRSTLEGRAALLTRLGEGGPIMDVAQVQSIRYVDSATTSLRIIETFSDGSHLVEQTISFSNIPPNLRIELSIFVGGVFFEDGSTTKVITAADFSEDGVLRFVYLRGAKVTTSVCHHTRIYDGTTQLK